MLKEQFVKKILSCSRESVKVSIKGWKQSEVWVGGTNPYCNDYTWCGIVIDSSEPKFTGKIIEKTYHSSYNGTCESWKFLDTMLECPKKSDFVPSIKIHNAGTQSSWEEGLFELELSVSYEEFPNLHIWDSKRVALLDKIQRAVDTRKKPGVKFGFINTGYQRNSFNEFPRIPSDAEIQHYIAGCKAVVVFFDSWTNAFSPKVDTCEIAELA